MFKFIFFWMVNVFFLMVFDEFEVEFFIIDVIIGWDCNLMVVLY